MKKQFFRVKQLADQAFLKAEKSEVLNADELQAADHRIETFRAAFSAVNKKICPNGPLGDKEKRLRKCVEHQLGTAFVEICRERIEPNSLLLQVLQLSGDAEHELGRDYASHEEKVEELVYTPLQRVLDVDLPSIIKQKHIVKKYCLDKDSASSRYNSTKKEAIKEDMEDADSKVQQNRDALAVEVFNLMARENEFAQYILQLLKLQRAYHESALKNLQSVIPKLEKAIDDSPVRRVFGVPLHEHLRVTERRIAYPLDICISTLMDYGLQEEGLFRIAGAVLRVKRLKAAIDSGCYSGLIDEYRDLHVLAGTLKSYLRELPEPLMTHHLHKEWLESMEYPDSRKPDVVKHIISKLPQANRENLAVLIQFLAKVAKQPENKMSSSNLAIVMAPNLLWDKNDRDINMGDCGTINMLVELLIKEAQSLFPDDMTKHLKEMYYDDDPSPRNGGNNGRIELADSTSRESLVDSPRANMRKKKPAAPVPPNRREDAYLSGSSTLSRLPKSHDSPGRTTKDLSRKRSFSKDDIKVLAHGDVSQSPPTLINDTAAAAAAAQSVIRLPPQGAEEERSSFKTIATHQVGGGESTTIRPVAAPRQSLMTDSASLQRTSSIRNKEEIQLRRPEEHRSLVKPEIPARPASLAPIKRTSGEDSNVHKTQSSVANKQQANMQNRTERLSLGHDIMMAEKERFLGHSPSITPTKPIENKFSDVNSNKEQRSRPTSLETEVTGCATNKPCVPPKSTGPLSKSSEKLNELNDNPTHYRSCGAIPKSHNRTRSDGNIVGGVREAQMHAPPSPRAQPSKPTEPPPPPPILPKPDSEGNIM